MKRKLTKEQIEAWNDLWSTMENIIECQKARDKAHKAIKVIIMKNTPAQKTLTAISRKYFNGKNYNDTHWYEVDSLKSCTGTVYEIIEKGKSKKIGDFEIQKNGFVVKFPTIPEDFIAELNKGKKAPEGFTEAANELLTTGVEDSLRLSKAVKEANEREGAAFQDIYEKAKPSLKSYAKEKAEKPKSTLNARHKKAQKEKNHLYSDLMKEAAEKPKKRRGRPRKAG